ncbi:MAG: hypothetical protein R3C55_14755 [Parvularculaceae bacterium]
MERRSLFSALRRALSPARRSGVGACRRKALPGLGGVIMVEATKSLMAPIGLVQRARSGALRPVTARSAAYRKRCES